jgi:hypothetical protein
VKEERRTVVVTNPNDEIRQQMLEYFYRRNSKATSKFGVKGSAVKISDVKAQLKELYGMTQQQVMANLTYLTDRGWVKQVDQEKTVTTRRGTTIPSVVTYFEISAEGIDKMEGESEFQPRERYPGINIQATGSNVISLGDGNVLNVEYRQLFNELNELKEAITASSDLSDQEKLDFAADIESLKDQLAKVKPNKHVVRELWSGIEKVATVSGLAQTVATVAPHIAHIMR